MVATTIHSSLTSAWEDAADLTGPRGCATRFLGGFLVQRQVGAHRRTPHCGRRVHAGCGGLQLAWCHVCGCSVLRPAGQGWRLPCAACEGDRPTAGEAALWVCAVCAGQGSTACSVECRRCCVTCRGMNAVQGWPPAQAHRHINATSQVVSVFLPLYARSPLIARRRRLVQCSPELD